MRAPGKKRSIAWILILMLIVVAIAGAAYWQREQIAAAWTNVTSDQVRPSKCSPALLGVYFSVADRYQIPWYLLAAIDKAERQDSADEIRLEKLARILSGAGQDATERQRIRAYNANDGFVTQVKQDALTFGQIDALVKGKLFPLAPQSGYTYRDDYGERRTYVREYVHEGVDIQAEKGTAVRSCSSGRVSKAGWDEKLGWYVEIEGEDGFYYFYGHLQEEPVLKSGTAVAKGAALGSVGDSGMGEKGTEGNVPPQLHFALYERGHKAFDPYPFLLEWDMSGPKAGR